jgi:metal-sulfur cluster biosynthetic enzyme
MEEKNKDLSKEQTDVQQTDRKLQMEEKVVEMLRTVYDPEIPVDIYNLGLIYKIDLTDDYDLSVDMTLTAPNCPAADYIVEDVRQKLESISGIRSAPR